MITTSVKGSIAELSRALGPEGQRKLKREIAAAVNATARATKNMLAKENAKELATSQKVIKETIAVSRKATAQTLGATVTQRRTSRISLKQFGARQTKRGVSYKVSKTKGRKVVPSGFVVDKLGSHAYKRTSKTRLPIIKLFGPSPWGVTSVNRLDRLIAKRDVKPELIKQIKRRIQAVNFKKTQG